MRGVRLILLASLLGGSIVAAGTAAPAESTIALLDRYLAGSFDEVTRTFDERTDFNRLLKELNRDGDAWMAAGGAGERERRELAAATFALEAARASEWYEWKWIIKNDGGGKYVSPNVYWKPAPLLIEWGCELLRQPATPRSIERVWQLAAMGVAQRGEDPQFQIGNTEVDPGDRAAAAGAVAAAGPKPVLPRPPIRGLQQSITRAHPDEVLNIQDEIKHLMHVTDRFPSERRFMLGQGIARERNTAVDSIAIYQSLADDQWVGAEARTRLGALLLRQNRVPDALIQFDRVERMTRDSYVLYLARLFRGQAFLRLKQEDNALAALRGAVAVRPGMQSASVLLAELLIKNELRGEAQTLMAAVLANAGGYDPYLEYAHADDRFWPQLIAELRAEIRR